MTSPEISALLCKWPNSNNDTVAQFASQAWDCWKNGLWLSAKNELGNRVIVGIGPC